MIAFNILLVLSAISRHAGSINVTSPMPRLIELANPENKTTLKFVPFINYQGVISFGPICTEGMRLALEVLANSSLQFFKTYNLIIEPIDDACSRPLGIPKAVNRLGGDAILRENVVPLTSCSVCVVTNYIGQMFKFFNFVGLAMTTTVPEVYTNRRLFESFYQVLDPNENIFRALADFMIENNWRKVAVLSEEVSYFVTLEQILSAEFGRRNISILGMTKFSLTNGFPDELSLEGNVQQLKWLDARIIAIQTATPWLVECMLYKYNISGPNYVILVNSVGYSDPVRFPRYSWCSKQAILEMLKISFVFGAGIFSTYDASRAKDSFGITGSMYDRIMATRITGIEKSPTWNYMRMLCYDEMLTTGVLLDKTESFLNKNLNQTMKDWVTSSRNYQQNGTFIRRTIEGRIPEVQFQGLSNRIDFSVKKLSSSLTSNAGPIIQQVRQVGESFALAGVRAFDYTNNQVFHGPNNISWVTSNQKPPLDSVIIISSQVPFLNEAVVYVVTAASCCLIVSSFVAFILCIAKRPLLRLKETTSELAATQFVGDLLMLSSNLFLNDWIPSTGRCSIVAWLAMSGFSVMLISQTVRLEVPLHYMIRRRHGAVRNNTKRTIRIAVTIVSISSLASFLLAGIVVFGLTPVGVGTHYVDIIDRSATQGQAFAEKRYVSRCDLQFPDADNNSSASMILIALWLIIHGVIAARATFLAFYMRNKVVEEVSDLTTICIATLGILSTILAGAAASSIFVNNTFATFQLTIGVTVILCSMANLTLSLLTKLRSFEPPTTTASSSVIGSSGVQPFSTLLVIDNNRSPHAY